MSGSEASAPEARLKAPTTTDDNDVSTMIAEESEAQHVHTGTNSSVISREGTPPPLPPRPRTLSLLSEGAITPSKLRSLSAATTPTLQGKATTALSLPEVQTYNDGRKGVRSPPGSRRISYTNLRAEISKSGSEADDSVSVQSYGPTLEAGEDVESLLGDIVTNQEKTAWNKLLSPRQPESALFPVDESFEREFDTEFDDLEDTEADGSNEGQLLSLGKPARANLLGKVSVLRQWKGKLKHFLILTSAGKPVYSRHGDDSLITHYVGVIQTIISFYQDVDDLLKGFTAGDVRFVVVSKGFLNLVAISRLQESDVQLRAQLEALYMQILSTLTLPVMERMFKNRASTDLRRPLQGTEVLLSALADGFTRGSPSTLLSALECLKLRKSHRHVVNSTLLKTRSDSILYGLIVANGRLVSVVRPKKHSLHPGDLQLIFNMLFEAGSVKAGGGENWIPLCLPGFNNTGYVYMYVSFLSLNDAEPSTTRHQEDISNEHPSTRSGDSEIAIIFISTNKESFFELRQMRDDLVAGLTKNGGLDAIRTAVNRGRPSCTDIVPGSPLRHFLYKSRGNVQYVMPSYSPNFSTTLAKRHLMTLYASLHAQLHARPTNLKVFHSCGATALALAWITPLFELYTIAPATTSRAALAQAANGIVQWVRKEEERVFIIGGAVF